MRGALQQDLAAAFSLQRAPEPSSEPAALQQQQRSGQLEQPPGGPSAGSEQSGRGSSDGGVLAGKLAALAATKAAEPRSSQSKLSCGVVEEEGKVQVSTRLLCPKFFKRRWPDIFHIEGLSHLMSSPACIGPAKRHALHLLRHDPLI